MHVDAPHGNHTHRTAERHNTAEPAGKNKQSTTHKPGQEKGSEKADRATERTTHSASIVSVNRTVPVGVTSVSSVEPTQSKFFLSCSGNAITLLSLT